MADQEPDVRVVNKKCFEKKGATMKKAQSSARFPPDLDRAAKMKFRELLNLCGEDVDRETLANFARQYSILVSLRRERAKQESAGIFEATVAGRDTTKVLNPLIVAETRTIAALNKMLLTLGVSPARSESARKQQANPPPAGMSGPEPAYGWELERALCGDSTSFFSGGKHGTKN